MARLEPLGQPSRVTLSPAACAADLGDGSERGEYVNQDYLLRVLGRPHRSINLMYCYYPLDKGWPVRASVKFARTADFAWAYPYDDYFPYTGGPPSRGRERTKGEPFRQIRDIRRHGQDVTLTLTMDCKVPDSHIRWIARELKPFGRIRIRLNHEADGNWFAFNKRYDYRTVGKFFVKFTGIVKSVAPDIKMVCCWGSVDWTTGGLSHADELAPMLAAADVWAIDKYLALHWGWPHDLCEIDTKGPWKHEGLDLVWKEMYIIYEDFVRRSGQRKPVEICEFNCDGDVEGGLSQANELRRWYERVRAKRPEFLRAITYYQFRDRGRLGLEQEDPNNPAVGVATPFLAMYRDLIRDPYFLPGEKWTRLAGNARLTMDWRGSDDSDGLGWKVRVKGVPSFLELKLPKEANLIVKVGAEWFYKRSGTEWVDATSAAAGMRRGGTLPIVVFAPPADGTNGGAPSVKSRLARPPELRLRYPVSARSIPEPLG